MKKCILALVSLLCLSAAIGLADGYTPGTYTGVGAGRNGDITVSVTVNETAIERIDVLSHSETAGISEPAIEQIPGEIVAYQSLAVDAVAGATLTSDGIVEAVVAALTEAGADIEALRSVEIIREDAPIEDINTQIVVVGGGVSGVTAAVTAAHEGAQVLLIEKLGHLGGSSATAAGGLVIVNSETNDPELDDSLETVIDAVKLIHADSELQPDYDYLSSILLKTGPAIDYMKSVGMEFDTDQFNIFARIRCSSGAVMMNRLQALAEENGVTVMLNTVGEKLLVENGVVTGIQATANGQEFAIHADKVILATGGANYDKERLIASTPQLADMDYFEYANIGNTGDGFRMLEEIGAAMSPQTLIKSGFLTLNVGQMMWNTQSALVVGADGKRLFNEAPIQSTMSNTWAIQMNNAPYYAIYNSGNAPAYVETFAELSKNNDPKVVLWAETIEELAEKAGLPADALTASFNRYQELALVGEDTDFSKASSYLLPYAEGEGYYLAYVQPSSWGTMGGSITDESFHVLDTEGNIIPNVFAIGETATGRLFGDQYVGAFSLGLYMTAGQVSGMTAVAELGI